MKIKIDIDCLFYGLLEDISDKTRMYLIIKLILTAPDAQEFHSKLIKKLNKNTGLID